MNAEVTEISENGKATCAFCHKSEVNSLEWGPLYQWKRLTVHYFCLLFSCGLDQSGEDDEGILGFLKDDIIKELNRGKKLRCKFCKKGGTTIACCNVSCKMIFHFNCGLENGCEFQFIGNYESYCARHKAVQDVDISMVDVEEICPICFDPLGNEVARLLWPPCCNKQSFHKICIKENARSQGALFKCPLCRDKEVFPEAMRKAGVYVPDRDAAWEMEPDAFAGQMQHYSICDAEICQCRKGRDFNHAEDSNPWKIVRCGACAASAIHKRCGDLKNLSWRCPTCSAILSSQQSSSEQNDTSISLSEDSADIVENVDSVTTVVVPAGAVSLPVVPTTHHQERPQKVRKPKIVYYDERLRRNVFVENSSDSDDVSDSEFQNEDEDPRDDPVQVTPTSSQQCPIESANGSWTEGSVETITINDSIGDEDVIVVKEVSKQPSETITLDDDEESDDDEEESDDDEEDEENDDDEEDDDQIRYSLAKCTRQSKLPFQEGSALRYILERNMINPHKGLSTARNEMRSVSPRTVTETTRKLRRRRNSIRDSPITRNRSKRFARESSDGFVVISDEDEDANVIDTSKSKTSRKKRPKKRSHRRGLRNQRRSQRFLTQ